MKECFEIFFFITVLHLCFTSDANSTLQNEPTGAEENVEETGKHVPLRLQNDISNILNITEFIQSINSALEKLNQRLERNENNIQILQVQSKESKNMLTIFETRLSELSRCSDRVDQTTIVIPTTVNSRTTEISIPPIPEEFLARLPLPQNGATFNGLTFETIVAALPQEDSIVVQIMNYMDADLTGYKSHLYSGSKSAVGSNTISANSREVATFQSKFSRPEGVISYRIKGTDISMHLYFECYPGFRTFAAAFLPNSAPLKSFRPVTCAGYKHIGSIGSYQCITNVSWDTSESIIINEGNIYAKVTFKPKQTTSSLTAEVFKMAF